MPETVKKKGMRSFLVGRLLLGLAYIAYRIWFYLLAAIPIFFLFPLLLLSTLSGKTYSFFYWLARSVWARFILFGMGCPARISRYGRWRSDRPQMIIANHTSMLDIMLMLRCCPDPIVFVGKKELQRIPVFGFFYRRVCILVDRDNAQSKAEVYKQVEERLSTGLNVCIFPEGGVPEESVVLDEFKQGAFRMADQHAMDVIPFVFYDCKRRFSWSYFKGGPGPLRARQLMTLSPEDRGFMKEARHQTRALIEKELLTDAYLRTIRNGS